MFFGEPVTFYLAFVFAGTFDAPFWGAGISVIVELFVTGSLLARRWQNDPKARGETI
jgi:hypothetical protein